MKIRENDSSGCPVSRGIIESSWRLYLTRRRDKMNVRKKLINKTMTLWNFNFTVWYWHSNSILSPSNKILQIDTKCPFWTLVFEISFQFYLDTISSHFVTSILPLYFVRSIKNYDASHTSCSCRFDTKFWRRNAVYRNAANDDRSSEFGQSKIQTFNPFMDIWKFSKAIGH